MARTFPVSVCVAMILLASAHADASSPTSSQLAAARSLARTGDWEIRWDDETSSPATLVERRTSLGAAHRRRRTFDAPARAQAFLREHAALFPLRDGIDSLVVVAPPAPPPNRNPMSTVRFVQHYRGIPVEWGGYAVTLTPEGTVSFVNGRFHAGIEVDPEPSIDAKEAEAIALREVGEGADPPKGPTTPVVTAREGDYRLAWSVTVPQDPLRVWRVYVDAHDGSVISRGNMVIVDPR